MHHGIAAAVTPAEIIALIEQEFGAGQWEEGVGQFPGHRRGPLLVHGHWWRPIVEPTAEPVSGGEGEPGLARP